MHYFKGVMAKTIEFGETETTIAAPNGSGKSTVVDAFFWCLWGKNAAGQSDQKFAVKTLDKSGTEIPHVNHEVKIVLVVDGEEQTFRRVLVPEYDKEDNLNGNHTEYFWNDVPMKKGDYDQKVNDVVKETVFRLVTSPYAFLQLDWQKQRETLMRMAGEIKNEDVEGNFAALVAILRTKTLEEYRNEVTAKLKRVNESMADIPARIDEVKRGMPEAPDTAALEEERKNTEKMIADIDREDKDDAAAINAKNAERNAVARQISDLKFKQSQMLNDAQAKERNEIHAANAKYNEAERQMKALTAEEANDAAACKTQHTFLTSRLDKVRENRTLLEKELATLRENWKTVNAQNFSADEYLKCPLYGHLCQDGSACSMYDQNQGAAFDKFMADKNAKLDEINTKGQKLKAELEASLEEIAKAENDLKAIKEGYDAREKDRLSKVAMCDATMKQNPKRPLISTITGTDIPEWVELGLQIAEMEQKLSNMVEYTQEADNTNAELRGKLMQRLSDITMQLGRTVQIEQAEKRIAELEEEMHKLAAQKLQLEIDKAMCRDFEVAKMNMITDKVNCMFKIVRWKMFARQVNGEEIPACICLCGGVPWTDANEAGKLNAGIDVAYTLSTQSGISAPMFIDGAEKSLDIYYPGGQRILLKVAAAEELTTK